jgi:hypothetical protein
MSSLWVPKKRRLQIAISSLSILATRSFLWQEVKRVVSSPNFVKISLVHGSGAAVNDGGVPTQLVGFSGTFVALFKRLAEGRS